MSHSGVMVTPRSRRVGESASLPLDRALAPRLKAGSKGLVVVVGSMGAGKSIALDYPREKLPKDLQIGLFDEGNIDAAIAAAGSRVAVLTSYYVGAMWPVMDVVDLAPWTLDDCIEYLAAAHRQQCASVIARLKDDASLAILGGRPELLTWLMDRMAADPALRGAREALHQGVQRGDLPERILRHPIAQIIETVERAAKDLENAKLLPLFETTDVHAMIEELAFAIRDRSIAISRLKRLFRNPSDVHLPLAAGVLVRIEPDWHPPRAKEMYLAGARLAFVRWSSVCLERANMSHAQLSGADLSAAVLTRSEISDAFLKCVNLRAARLMGVNFKKSLLAGADLSGAIAENAKFAAANLESADLTGANLKFAVFARANLEKASLRRSMLCGAYFSRTIVNEADFMQANLNGAGLYHVDMSGAVWTGATFCGSALRACNLEGLDLPGCDFTEADLRNSLLTGTRIRSGRFVKANLRDTGLADVDWTGSDLRGADFTNASFHMGSTRSGLVGSAIPCEGSRTDFYTDEFNEQDYKPPEEIRKACLFGCDLRGAKVEGTDFYLVDLRRAVYTADQRDYFRKCGAILQPRGC